MARDQCAAAAAVFSSGMMIVVMYFLPTCKTKKAIIDVDAMIAATGRLLVTLKKPTPADDNPATPI